jgi:hypothetical protein
LTVPEVDVMAKVCGKVVVAPIVICPPGTFVESRSSVTGAIVIVRVAAFAEMPLTVPAIVTVTALVVAAIGVPLIVTPVLAVLMPTVNPGIGVLNAAAESSTVLPATSLLTGIAVVVHAVPTFPVSALYAVATLSVGLVGSFTVTLKDAGVVSRVPLTVTLILKGTVPDLSGVPVTEKVSPAVFVTTNLFDNVSVGAYVVVPSAKP